MDKLTPNLTEDQLKANIDSLVSQKADSKYIQSYIDNYGSDGNGGYSLKNQQQEQPATTIGGEIKQAASDTFVKPFTDRLNAVTQRQDQSKASDVLQTAGALAGGVMDIGFNAVKEGIKVFTPKMVEDKISEYANKAGVAISGAIPDSAKQFLADHPEALANTQAFIDIATVVPALKPVAMALSKGTKIGVDVATVAGKNAAETISTALTPSEKSLESKVLSTFQKGVKPSIAGKKTIANVAQYKDNIISGVKTIKENTANLSFTTDTGETLVGQTPKTLQQFTDAIEQTKKTVFSKYDELAKKAGAKGVSVDVAPISKELDTVINDKALSITNPNAIQYAKDLQERLIKTGSLDAVTAQDVIQQYNKSLEAFYRNPSYDNATHAAIDAAVANNMRKVLDEGISGLTGAEYGALKKQYGALKSIEQDVIKATLRDARKNTKGLIDFTDIFSGSQLAHGLLTLNPATITSGLVSKGIATVHKVLNDPNRSISKMFDAASKLPEAGSKVKSKGIRGMINLGEMKKALTPSELSKETLKAQKVNVVPSAEITKMAKGLTSTQRNTIADFLDNTSNINNELKVRKMFNYMGLNENISKIKLEKIASTLKDEFIASKKSSK